MRLLDLTLADAAANLALDEALLLSAEESDGPEVLRFWELPSYAVVVGAGGSVAADVNTAACEADRVPILRRASGGGTVLLGPGCLCFTLVHRYASAPGLEDIRASNRHVLDRMASALQPFVDARFQGTSDLTDQGLKISGNAQQRKRRHFLHHGTLLCSFDVSQLAKYLLLPDRQPDYRKKRPHAEFVTNIQARVEEIKRRLAGEWFAEGEYASIPLEAAQQLMTDKYTRAEWNLRR